MRLTPQSEAAKVAVYITGVLLVAAFLLMTPRSPGIAPVLAQVSSCGNAILEPGEQCEVGSPCGAMLVCVNCQCQPASSSCGNAILDPGEECDPPGPNSTQCPSSPAGSFLTCNPTCVCCNPTPEICGNTTDDDCDGLIDCSDPDCAGQPPCIRRDPSRIRFDVGPTRVLDLFTSHGKVNAPEGFSVAGKAISWKVTNARGVVYEGTLQPGDLTSNHNLTIRRFRDNAARLGQGTHDGIFTAKIQTGTHGTISYHVKAYGDLSSATDADMAIHFTVGSGATAQAWGTSGKWKRTSRGWVAGRAELVGFK